MLAAVPDTRELLLDLQINGEPTPKTRVRFGKGRAYTTPNVLAAEREIEILARQQVKTPARGPVALHVDFYMGNARKVDWDNLAKLVCDALNGIVWDDDSQIVRADVGKFVDRAKPRVEMTVWRLIEQGAA
jgi:Holliday junction resolvase RusA-like endonuclease